MGASGRPGQEGPPQARFHPTAWAGQFLSWEGLTPPRTFCDWEVRTGAIPRLFCAHAEGGQAGLGGGEGTWP